MQQNNQAEQGISYTALLSDSRFISVVAISTVGVFGSQVVSPVLPSIAAAFDLSEARVGLVVSAFFLPTIVTIPLSGVLADVYGRRRIVLGSLLLFGGSGGAIAATSDFQVLLVLRAIQGIGLSGLTPLAVTILGDMYTDARAAAAYGIRSSVHGVAQILIPVAAGGLAEVAWNFPFLLYLVAIPMFGLAFVYLPETGQRVTNPDLKERVSFREYWQALRVEAYDRDIAIITGASFIMFLLRSAVMTFVPLFAVQSLATRVLYASFLLSLLGGAKLVVSPLAGYLVLQTSRKKALIITHLFPIVGVTLLALSPSIYIAGTAVLIYGVGIALFTPVLNNAITDIASDARRGGIVSGLNVTKTIATVVGPAVFGVAATVLGFRSMFLIGTVVVAGYTLLIFFLLEPLSQR